MWHIKGAGIWFENSFHMNMPLNILILIYLLKTRHWVE